MDQENKFQVGGATYEPTYYARNPPMWVVSDTDMKALSIAGVTANACYAFGSFLFGAVSNVLVSYAGADKITDTGRLMLHGLTPFLAVVAVAFFLFGGYMTYKKQSLWDQIKSESKPTSR